MSTAASSVSPVVSEAVPQDVRTTGPAALMAGSRWAAQGGNGPIVISYSFAQADSGFNPAASSFSASMSALSEADRDVTRKVLANIEAVCNVQFVEVPDSGGSYGVLRYAYSQRPNDMGYSGFAFYPSSNDIGGDIWIGRAQAGAEWSHYRPGLILHETLHALGLKHPFEGGETLGSHDDVITNTVMSYSPVEGNREGALSHYPDEPMALDIQALQALYGAARHNADDTVYNIADDAFQGNFRVIWDSSGNDTLDASQAAGSVHLDLSPGAASAVGLTVHAFAYSGSGGSRTVSHSTYDDTLRIDSSTWIENATGSAHDDVLTGNGLDNRLAGGDGNDALHGQGGNDILLGGEGQDTAYYQRAKAGFQIDRVADGYRVVDRSGAEGTDMLRGVERLVFADRHVALDLDGNAGLAAKILGAVVGTAAILNPSHLGRVLAQLDSGHSASQVADYVIDAALGVPHTHESFVNLLYGNVTGAVPTAAEQAYYTRLLDTGMASQASLALLAAEGGANLARINLTGLAEHGLEYVPYA